jgi:hypothetical protein
VKLPATSAVTFDNTPLSTILAVAQVTITAVEPCPNGWCFLTDNASGWIVPQVTPAYALESILDSGAVPNPQMTGSTTMLADTNWELAPTGDFQAFSSGNFSINQAEWRAFDKDFVAPWISS